MLQIRCRDGRHGAREEHLDVLVPQRLQQVVHVVAGVLADALGVGRDHNADPASAQDRQFLGLLHQAHAALPERVPPAFRILDLLDEDLSPPIGAGRRPDERRCRAGDPGWQLIGDGMNRLLADLRRNRGPGVFLEPRPARAQWNRRCARRQPLFPE